MISLLSKLFIKNYQNYEAPKVRQAYGMLCGSVGICLNILLFIGKWLAGVLSGSIAITADASTTFRMPVLPSSRWWDSNFPVRSRIRNTPSDTEGWSTSPVCWYLWRF